MGLVGSFKRKLKKTIRKVVGGGGGGGSNVATPTPEAPELDVNLKEEGTAEDTAKEESQKQKKRKGKKDLKIGTNTVPAGSSVGRNIV